MGVCGWPSQGWRSSRSEGVEVALPEAQPAPEAIADEGSVPVAEAGRHLPPGGRGAQNPQDAGEDRAVIMVSMSDGRLPWRQGAALDPTRRQSGRQVRPLGGLVAQGVPLATVRGERCGSAGPPPDVPAASVTSQAGKPVGRHLPPMPAGAAGPPAPSGPPTGGAPGRPALPDRAPYSSGQTRTRRQGRRAPADSG